MKAQTGNRRRVMLGGATGYLGRHVVAELLERGYDVLAPVRPGRGHDDPLLEGCELLETDVTDAARLSHDLGGRPVHAVVSCLASRTGSPRDTWRIDHDANLHLLEVAKTLGARRFVMLSAICVQRPRLEFQRAKLAFEARLMASGLEWSIVRPTAYFKSLAGQVERVRQGKPFLVFGNGTLTACKPVAESDLATYIADCLERPDRANRVLPVGGPGPALTPRDQGALLCASLGRTPAFRHVPPGLLLWAARFLGLVGRWSPRFAERAEFARIGHYYATESMLVWDESAGTYNADMTPETGHITLGDFYGRIEREGMADQDLGAHRLFDKAPSAGDVPQPTKARSKT
jgi:divinyl chlorophyllide a 8-vinyl-reductase